MLTCMHITGVPMTGAERADMQLSYQVYHDKINVDACAHLWHAGDRLAKNGEFCILTHS